MPMHTDAIVLRVMDYGESDRIVTFCTADFGKIRGIAKGARRSRKRFANVLEPFSCSRIQFSRTRPEGLALIEICDGLCDFPAVRGDLEKTLAASYLTDLIDHFTPEDKNNHNTFLLLRDFLHLLEGNALSESLLRFFEIRLLRVSGFDPVLDHCLVCKRPVEKPSSYRFEPAGGGLACIGCGIESPESVRVSIGTVRMPQLARETEIGLLGRLQLSGRLAEESRLLLAHFIHHILGREPRSVHVLHEIRRLGI